MQELKPIDQKAIAAIMRLDYPGTRGEGHTAKKVEADRWRGEGNRKQRRRQAALARRKAA